MKLHLIRVTGFQFDLILVCSELRIKGLFVSRRRKKINENIWREADVLRTTLKEVDSDGL